MSQRPKITNLSELARDLNLNKSALYHWKRGGLIVPSQKIGNMEIYDRAETIAIIAELVKVNIKKRSPQKKWKQ